MAFGQHGSCFTDANSQVTPPAGLVIVALQFIDSGTFDELSPVGGPSGLSFGDSDGDDASDATLQEVGSGSGGLIIKAGGDSNLTTFPEGMTIYGRWESFTLDAEAGGGVIAYFGP